MLLRVVKLKFREDKIPDFLKLYEKHMQGIRQFKGCKMLHLMEDHHTPGLFFTYSKWENEESLQEYRKSIYFNEIWGKVKPWFSEKAEAWSLRSKEMYQNVKN